MARYGQMILPCFSLPLNSQPAFQLLQSHMLPLEASPESPCCPPDHTFPCANSLHCIQVSQLLYFICLSYLHTYHAPRLRPC